MEIALVIGGTGTLGSHFIPQFMDTQRMDRVRVLSRNEENQLKLQRTMKYGKNIDFFIGDVRDERRVMLASRGCSSVFHFAAMKSVDKAEYNPNEAILTNIEGTRNVIFSCLENKVSKAIFISTDKAVDPINIYGASKLSGEKLFIQSNAYAGKDGTRFNSVRYGNVLGSNLSVLPKWEKEAEKGFITLTDPSMTRFFMTANQAAAFVLECYRNADRGETWIPKMKATSMGSLADSFIEIVASNVKKTIVGIRPGEKLHETLISKHELHEVTEEDKYFVRWPFSKDFAITRHGKEVHLTEGYTSNNATRFQPDMMQSMIQEWRNDPLR